MYQRGSFTIDRHTYGKSKTAFGWSVALIETWGKQFEVYLVICNNKKKIEHNSAIFQRTPKLLAPFEPDFYAIS